MVPFLSIPKTIHEGEEEEEEEDVPLQRRTQIARVAEQEKRISSIIIPPSTLEEPLEVSSLEEKVQQWVGEQDVEGDDLFKMSNFDFMPMGK